MGTTIGIDALAATIQKELKELGTKADLAIDKAGKTAAEAAVKTLKSTSPKGGKAGKTGKYARGWRVKAEGGAAGHLYIIHNSTDYQLTHLLEKGHALRQGGRSPAIVHIAPVEQQAIKQFEENLRRFIQL